MGPGRFELPTSRLSGVRSNQLSYEPNSIIDFQFPVVDCKSEFGNCKSKIDPVGYNYKLNKEQ